MFMCSVFLVQTKLKHKVIFPTPLRLLYTPGLCRCIHTEVSFQFPPLCAPLKKIANSCIKFKLTGHLHGILYICIFAT